MDDRERAQLVKLINALNVLRDFQTNLPIRHASAFLQIAVAEGLSITDLSRANESLLGTVSRYGQALSKPGKDGRRLVVNGYGRDNRTKALYLTGDGKTLIVNMLAALDPSSFVAAPTPPPRIVWNPFEV